MEPSKSYIQVGGFASTKLGQGIEQGTLACRMSLKLSMGFTPFHFVYGEDAMMLANLLFPSIQMMECLGMHKGLQMDI